MKNYEIGELERLLSINILLCIVGMSQAVLLPSLIAMEFILLFGIQLFTNTIFWIQFKRSLRWDKRI